VPWWEAIGEVNLAIEVALEAESAPGDLPRETCPEGEFGTGRGEEACFRSDIVSLVRVGAGPSICVGCDSLSMCSYLTPIIKREASNAITS